MDRRFRWAAVFAAVLFAVAIGGVAYNVGVSHGVAIGAVAPGASAPSAAPAAPYFYGPYPYGWYRPWGFGFGPIVFVLFWFLVFRFAFWGGMHRRRWYYRGPHDVPPSFEEWHRRAHERLNGQTPASTEGRA
jgi:hypothetical protein